MAGNLIEIDTRGMTRAEWEAARRGSIGGSDAAAIMGMTPYASPYSLWAEKTGLVVPEDISMKEPVRLGVYLEDYVAKRFTESTGKRVMRKNAILKNADFQWAHANVDRLVVGEGAGLECKTTSALNLRKFRGGEFPARYYVQCMHYMAVTGRALWYLAVLIGNSDFKWFEIPRDEEDIQTLMDAERTFWGYVENRTEPPLTGTQADADVLQYLYPEGDGGEIELFGRGEMLERYALLGDQIKALEQQRDVIKQTIQQDMGVAERASADGFRVSWANRARKNYDTKRFNADHPGLLAGYEKTSKYRVFEVKKGN